MAATAPGQHPVPDGTIQAFHSQGLRQSWSMAGSILSGTPKKVICLSCLLNLKSTFSPQRSCKYKQSNRGKAIGDDSGLDQP